MASAPIDVDALGARLLGALPVLVLVLAAQNLQSGLWQLTAWPFAHDLLSVCVAVCSGAVYFGIERRWG